MIKGGTGGSTTLTGLQFEANTDLKTILDNLHSYTILDNKLFYNNHEIGLLAPKKKLYKLILEPKGINYKDYISKQLLPDEALYLYNKDTVYIVEKKWQQGAGSVDEKIQTCDFKKRQYMKLFSSLGLNVEYIYLLSDWFKHDSYRDVLDYIEDCGCKYCFNELPLHYIGLDY